MKARKKFLPFVRRANGREKSESLRIAFRLAFYQSLGRPFFVMVQKGFPNLVIEVAATKLDCKRIPLLVSTGRKTFTEWARGIKRNAQGRKAAR